MNTSAEFAPVFSVEGEAKILDRVSVMDRVGGDEDLLREITAIFLEEYPALIREIEMAMAANDPRQVERSAHTLKGSVANFGAEAATQAAHRLETLGRRGDLQNAVPAFEELLARFQQLHPLLEQLAC